MYKLNTYIFWLVVCSQIISSTLFGTSRPCPGQFLVAGEWIYFHPSIGNLYYAIDNTGDIGQNVGKRHANEMDFQSGFQIQAMYAFCNCCVDLRVAWTCFCADHSDSISGVALNATKPTFSEAFLDGTARSKVNLEFNRVESLLGYQILPCRKFILFLEGGVQYSDIQVEQDITYNQPAPSPIITNVVHDKRTYWGVGPQLGLALEYCIWDCLSIVGNFSGALLVGETKTRFISDDIEQGITTPFYNITNETLWQVVPNTRIRIGLDYLFCCWGHWDLEVGYDFLYYSQALDTVAFIPARIATNAVSSDTYDNVSLHGPYVSLSLTF